MLEGVITSGTGAGYTYYRLPSEAGKTGTSEGLSDAWFVGYTPLYSTAVWTGHPLSRDYTGFGGPTSGPIWRSYMEAAQGSNCPDFEIPSTLPTLTAYHGEHTASSSSSCSTSTSQLVLLRVVDLHLPDGHGQQRPQQGCVRARCGTEARANTKTETHAHANAGAAPAQRGNRPVGLGLADGGE